MNEKTTMMINEGMLIWAFGCAVNHEDTAAIVIATLIQIGTMKAIGMTNGEIRTHYMMYGLLVPLIGALIRIPLGKITVARVVILLRHHTWLLLGYGAMAFILPSDQFTFAQLLALLLLIFAPVMAVYAARVFAEGPEKTYHGGRLTNDIE